ncbi:MAG: nucleotidyl transferase AbiEii/AbiGii toxin family protein [Candidatus Eisenbacteria bacterium]|nr:nucleotidyl transferase AbiEii/AbiGii toxin family protein [Candidatus Eisenbacteria bacterium]
MPLKGKGILTDLQKAVIFSFRSVPDSQHFYLTGGTALAEFYLGHRKSFDLDLFTAEKGLIVPFSWVLEEELKKEFSVGVVRRFESFVELEMEKTGESTRVQLAYDSPFRFEQPLESDLGIKVNDYRDLVTDKMLAFFGRVEPRDAVDLFLILKNEDVWNLSELAQKKDPGFDLYWLAIAMQKTADFPDEIEKWPVEMTVDIDGRELKDTFSTLSRRMMERLGKSPL